MVHRSRSARGRAGSAVEPAWTRADLTASARAAASPGSTPVDTEGKPDPAATAAATEAVGGAMIEAGYSVNTVREALEDIARVNGLPASQIVVFPTALLVSARGEDDHHTGAASSGERHLLLCQVDEVQRTVDAARTGVLDPASTISRINRVRRWRCHTARSCASRVRASEHRPVGAARGVVGGCRARRRARRGRRGGVAGR